MPIESSVSVISDLNVAYPADTDIKSVGPQHFRNIKTAAKSLNASGGAAQIGQTQGTASSLLQTLQARLREKVSAFSCMSDAQRADVIAGSLTLDVTTALQAVITDNPGKNIVFPAGSYKITGTLYVRSDNTALWGSRGAGLYQHTADIDSVVYEPTTAGTTAAYLNHPGHYYLGVNHVAAVAAVHTAGSAIVFRQCNQAQLFKPVVNNAFRSLTVMGGQGFTWTDPRFFAATGSYAGADTCLVSFEEAPYGGGSYQNCYTGELKGHFISPTLLRDGCIRISNGDGIQLGKGYIANGKNCLVFTKSARDGSNIAVVTVGGYLDCVDAAKTVNAVEIRDDGFTSSNVYMVKVENATLGNGVGIAVKCRKPETTEVSVTNCSILNMGTYAVDAEGGATTDVRLIGNQIQNCGDGSSAAVRATDLRSLTVVGNNFSATDNLVLSLPAGHIGQITIVGNTNNSDVADINLVATYDSLEMAGNSSAWTGVASQSWKGANQLAAKSTLDDDDLLTLTDSADNGASKQLSGSDLLAQLFPTGSITPSLTFGGAAVGMTFGTRAGSWTRTNDRIHASGVVPLTAKGSSTGIAVITGLPVTVAENTPVTIRIINMAAGVGDTFLSGLAEAGTTAIRLDKQSAGTVSQLTEADFAATSQIQFSVTYKV